MKTIEESGLFFGPFDEEKFYRIEDSPVRKKSQNAGSSVDFLLIRKDTVIFIEAKSSARDNKENRRLLAKKFVHSLSLFISYIVGLHQNNAKSQNDPSFLFIAIDLSKTKVKYIVVVNGLEKRHCAPFKASLNKYLDKLLNVHKIYWKLQHDYVFVLNEVMAKDFGIVEKT
jgi:hypothetical protein